MAKRNFIKSAIKHPGSFTAQAKKRDETPAQLQKQVLAHKKNYSSTTVKRAELRKTLVGMKKK